MYLFTKYITVQLKHNIKAVIIAGVSKTRPACDPRRRFMCTRCF